MAFSEILYRVSHPLLGAAARNRWLIHRLFHIRIPKQITVHFDPTTWLLHWTLQRSVRPEDQTALEVGIGQGALLALGLQKATNLVVHGVDCSELRVRSSQQVAAYNQLESHFYTSDLFERVPAGQQFDLIFCNPPYVPTSQGQRLNLTRHMCADSDRVWDGGEDGSQVLGAILEQSHPFLTPRGRLLFGAQPIFLPAPRIEQMIADSNWRIVERVARRCVPSRVYVLTHRDQR